MIVNAVKATRDGVRDPATGRLIPTDRFMDVRACGDVTRMIRQGLLEKLPVEKPKPARKAKKKPEPAPEAPPSPEESASE